MNLREVLALAIERVKPLDIEVIAIEKEAREFVSLLKSKGLKAFIGGSLAKGTLVKTLDKHDVDIFIVFEHEDDTRELENHLKKIKLPGALKMIHGSRDYFQVEARNAIFEIVPVLKNVDSGLVQNVTDFSLNHVDYIRKIIRKNKKIRDEIILAKAFCEAQGVYGAEGYVKGFSGYSLEVLVSYFGGFVGFLKGIQKERIIDPAKHFKNKNEAGREINSSKLTGPLLLVDPTYKFRNISAGLSQETFEKFLKIAGEFLKKPTVDYFEKKKFDLNELKSFARGKKGKVLELKMSTEKQEGDIAGTKMKKFLDFAVSEFEKKGQKVIRKEFIYLGEGHTAHGYLVILETKEILVKGPPLKMKEACEGFKKGKKTFKKGGHLWAKKKISVDGILKGLKDKSSEMGVKIG